MPIIATWLIIKGPASFIISLEYETNPFFVVLIMGTILFFQIFRFCCHSLDPEFGWQIVCKLAYIFGTSDL
jgi:hypothetical protein